MAIRRRDRLAKTKQTTVYLDGEALEVHYRPAALTGDLLSQLDSAEGNDATPVFEAFCSLVAAWDYLDDNDQPFPVNMDTIPKIGDVELLMAVIQSVTGNMAPNPTSAGA